MKISKFKALSIEISSIFNKKAKNYFDAIQNKDFERALYLIDKEEIKESTLMISANYLYTDKDEKDRKMAMELMDKLSDSKFGNVICRSTIPSLLAEACEQRDFKMVEKILSLPSAMKASTSSLLNQAVYALPENDQRIKQIESRNINYDFGNGSPEIWKLFEDFIEKKDGKKLNVKQAMKY